MRCYAFYEHSVFVLCVRATMSVCLCGIECIIMRLHNKKVFCRYNVSENEPPSVKAGYAPDNRAHRWSAAIPADLRPRTDASDFCVKANI